MRLGNKLTGRDILVNTLSEGVHKLSWLRYPSVPAPSLGHKLVADLRDLRLQGPKHSRRLHLSVYAHQRSDQGFNAGT
jgi:hypothetical protein